jgi:hypothetical protein
MDKHVPRLDEAHTQDATDRSDEQPTWLRTSPRGNPEVDRTDLERSAERMEMLLGH